MTVSRLLAVLGALLALSAAVRVVVAEGATVVVPAATTGSASAVTGTTATLNGTVNPNGAATTWQFEYGTTTGYGSKAPARRQPVPVRATRNVSVSTSLTGLEPGITLPLPPHRDERHRHDGRRRRELLDARASRRSRPGAVSKVTTTSARRSAARSTRTGSRPPGASSTARRPPTARRRARRTPAPGRAPSNVTDHAHGTPGVRRRTTTAASPRAPATRSAARTRRSRPPRHRSSTTGHRLVGRARPRRPLTGKVDPRGRATTYYFEYGTTTSYGVEDVQLERGQRHRRS